MSRAFSTVSVGRPTRKCSASGRPLEVGERYVAALYEPRLGVPGVKQDVPERFDYSLDACASGKPPVRSDLGPLLACWRTVVGDPAKRDKPLLDDQTLLDLFEQTASDEIVGKPTPGTAEFHRAALRYVITLLLLRRRLVIQDGQRGDVLLIRQRGTPRPPEGPPPLKISDPGLDEQSLMEIITSLEHGGDPIGDPSGEPTGDPSGQAGSSSSPAPEGTVAVASVGPEAGR